MGTKQDDCPEENKDLENGPHISDLSHPIARDSLSPPMCLSAGILFLINSLLASLLSVSLLISFFKADRNQGSDPSH